jgi:hypothetical protein
MIENKDLIKSQIEEIVDRETQAWNEIDVEKLLRALFT